MTLFMPNWLKNEGQETNLSGTDQKIFDEKAINRELSQRKFNGCCDRCFRAYFISTQQNIQKYDWRCKYCRQRTISEDPMTRQKVRIDQIIPNRVFIKC